MKCEHCGEMVFAFEFMVETDRGYIHNFTVKDGRLECTPHEPLERQREDVMVMKEEIVLV